MRPLNRTNPAALRRLFHVGLVVAALIASACSLGTGSGSDEASDVFRATHGLDTLAAYRAVYRVAFDGQQGGETAQWTETYTLSVLREPAVRALSVEWTGRDESVTADIPVFAADLGNVLYWRVGPSDACLSTYASTEPANPGDLGGQIPELAERLPRVPQWEASGDPEPVNGIQAQRYTFDSVDLGAGGEAEAQGQVWMAGEGGYVARLRLVMQVDPSQVGPDTRGTFTIDYDLGPIDESIDAVLPQDCRLPLPELRHLEAASEVIDVPGYLQFESDVSVEEAAAFYQESITQAGLSLAGEPSISDSRARLSFSAPGQTVELSLDGGTSTTVSLIGHRTASGAAASPTGPAAERTESAPPAMDPGVRVVDALNLLLALDGEPVLPSYHLEVEHQSPAWDGSAVRSASSSLRADVQGTDVHFIDQTTQPNGSTSSTEAYIIDGQEYVVQGGVPVPGFGMASLSWTMWPLDPLSVLQAGASGAVLEGTETIDGRTAEVYAIRGSGMELPSFPGLGSLGIPVTRAQGRVWVDQATGALLRVIADYQADVKDDAGAVVGQGSGHLELTVSEVGAASVSLPGQ